MKPETAPIDVVQQQDGTVHVIARAPKDGAGRDKGRSWTYAMTRNQFDQWVDGLVWMKAGMQ